MEETYNYKCEKCGCTYAGLSKPLTYSSCVSTQSNGKTMSKCGGKLKRINFIVK